MSNEQQSRSHNEFRSDTFSTPSQEMLAQISGCTLGDAVYNEDEDTLLLQSTVAELAGHEAGLYCVSGTLSNQIAIRSHLFQPPFSVLCDYRAHIYANEAGGISTLSQAMVTAVRPSNGLYMTLEDILENFIPNDGNIHVAPTKLICLENTLHGIVYPIEEIKRISKFCKESGVPLHVDGARLWDASAATGISIKDYGELFDSMSLCLSKGLGAPVGTVLVGKKKFISTANHFKKQNGGGIRQSGILARMGLFAVQENFPKLPIAHAFAKEVAEYVESLGLILEVPANSNFVFLDQKKNKIDFSLFRPYGVKNGINCAGYRFAFSFQNSRSAVDALKKTLAEVLQASQTNPEFTNKVQSMYQGTKI
ncbi:hypothetical protein CANARDRAFT_8612 [[Candida] arabinofermentans NRRL YB-2248]|uniref:low-specificity L-threonine aldolase n=1 Tax=[Candida] arabinofermentans NRRL YB-2248 TaxID=983967 RepID=A0A1E4SYU4_9ASCO|nr:hypothetical protein CANARDRAFT_8612 [[Candida] arabinofermentans NRRL YB-2248]